MWKFRFHVPRHHLLYSFYGETNLIDILPVFAISFQTGLWLYTSKYINIAKARWKMSTLKVNFHTITYSSQFTLKFDIVRMSQLHENSILFQNWNFLPRMNVICVPISNIPIQIEILQQQEHWDNWTRIWHSTSTFTYCKINTHWNTWTRIWHYGDTFDKMNSDSDSVETATTSSVFRLLW